MKHNHAPRATDPGTEQRSIAVYRQVVAARKFASLAIILCAAALFTTGCTPKHHVRFDTGAPYQVAHRVDEEALVAFPDSIIDREYKIRVGSNLPWDKRMYIIPVYELYRSETLAHLNGLFTKGVTISTHSTLAKLEEMREERATAAREDTTSPTSSASSDSHFQDETELDRIIADLTAREQGDRTVDRSEQKLNEELFEAIGMEVLIERDPRYLLWFTDANLTAQNRRMLMSFRAQVRDRRTGITLLDKRYTGRTAAFEPVQSEDTNKFKLHSMTRETMNGLMKSLVADLADVTDARR